MTTPDWWQALVETALLGTERKSFDPAQLPVELQSSKATSSPEQALLQTAALATNYLWAGYEPADLALPDMPICEPETHPYAPKEAMQILAKLVDEPAPNRRLLKKWVDRCQNRNWILPPDSLCNLLARHKNGTIEVDPDALYHIIGNRGKWLGQINTDWSYEAPKTPEETWEEQNGSQALALYEIRLAQPTKARVLLEEKWDQQPLKEKKLLLSALNPGLSLEDEPFLEKLRIDLLSVKKPKTVQIEHFQLVSELLLAIPGSALFQEVVGQLRPYFKANKGIFQRLVGKSETALVLPIHFDDFFNEASMKKLGVEINADLSEQLLILSWFATLLIKVHPDCWAIILNDKKLRPVPFFMRQSWPEGERDAIAQVLAQMVRRFKRTDWVADLLPHKSAITEWPALLALLSPDEQQRLIPIEFDLTNVYGNYQFLTDEEATQWSLAFSEYVWEAIVKTWIKTPYLQGAERQFVRDAVAVIHPDILTNAQAAADRYLSGHQQYTFNEQVLTPLNRWLNLRRRINEL
ncbi:hypothetical protein GCM10027592_03750 [Spirosoma flavus]